MVMIPLLRVVMIPLLRSPSEHRFVHKKSASGLRGIPQAYEETNALLVFITQTFSRGSDGKCTKCHQAEGDHHGSSKFCYVSTTSPCPPPHVHGFVLLSNSKSSAVMHCWFYTLYFKSFISVA